MRVQNLSVRARDPSTHERATTRFAPAPMERARATLRAALESKWFERVLMALILANLVVLAIMDPLQDASSVRNTIVDRAEWVFLACFTLEAVVKICAYGPRQYFGSAWNVMDFALVLVGFLVLLPAISVRFSVVRALRILRALRTMDGIPAVRVLIGSLLASVPLVLDVLAVVLFVVFLFGILGMQVRPRRPSSHVLACANRNACALAHLQLWSGSFAQRCRHVGTGEVETSLTEGYLPLCSLDDALGRQCVEAGGPGIFWACRDNNENPNFGVTSFDHLGAAFLVIVQCITMEGWSDAMYQAMDASSSWAALYFVMLVVLGAFILLNLILAVINANLNRVERLERRAARLRELKGDAERTLVQRLVESLAHGATAIGDRVEHALEVVHLHKASPRKRELRERARANSLTPVGIGSGRSSRATSMADDGPETRHSPVTVSPKPQRATPPQPGTSSPLPNIRPRTFSSGSESSAFRPAAASGSPDLAPATPPFASLESTAPLPPLAGGSAVVAPTAQRTTSGRGNHVAFAAVATFKRNLSRFRASRDLLGLRGADPGGADNVAPVLRFRHDRSADAVKALVFHPLYGWALVGLILVNTVFLALEHDGMDADLLRVIDVANIVCTVLFILDVALRLYAQYPRAFFRDPFNAFDFAVVCMSIVEVIVSGSTAFTALRTLRLLRLFRLVSAWQSLRQLTTVLYGTLSRVSYFLAMLGLVLFIFALLGLHCFGGTFDGDKFPAGVKPRFHFDSVFWSFVTVFQVVTLDEWPAIMFNTVHATNWAAVIYFLAILVLMKYMILSVFTAILLQSFALHARQVTNTNLLDADLDENDGAFEAVHSAAEAHRGDAHVVRPAAAAVGMSLRGSRGTGFGGKGTGVASVAVVQSLIRSSRGAGAAKIAQRRERSMTEMLRAPVSASPSRSPSPSPAASKRESAAALFIQRRYRGYLTRKRLRENTHLLRLQTALRSTSLWFFTGRSRLRRRLVRLVISRRFELAVVLVIALSSLALAIPWAGMDEQSSLARVLFGLDIVFAVLFGLEAAVKIVAYGFALHRGSYLRDAWNVFDFAVTLLTILGLVLSDLKTFRVLRTFRPLRMMHENKRMKVTVSTLARSVPSFGNVLLLCGFFWLIFGIMGVQFFAGTFRYCLAGGPPAIETRADCPPGEWVNRPYHFDNIGAALLSLFAMSTLEGWADIMFSGIDARGVDLTPQRDYRPVRVLYFWVVIVVSLFLINVFIGIIVFFFKRQHDEMNGMLLLTDAQREWVHVQRSLARVQPAVRRAPAAGSLRLLFFRLVEHRAFDYGMAVLIVLNMVVLATQHVGQSSEWDDFIRYANFAFVGVYVAEAAAKVIAYRPAMYVRDPWNRLDLFLIVTALLGIALEGSGLRFSFMRMLRVCRLFRLVKVARGLQSVFRALYYSLPAFYNVGSLLGLLFFVYACLGVAAFGELEYGAMLGPRLVNFRTFPNALLTLFRSATGESWTALMQEMSMQSAFAVPYFVTFMVCVFFLLINLFVAVVTTAYTEEVTRDMCLLTEEHIERFRDTWSQFDPDATLLIDVEQLPELLFRVDPFLASFQLHHGAQYVLRTIALLNLRLSAGNKLHYHEVADALARHCYGLTPNDHLPLLPECAARYEIEREVRRLYPELQAPRAPYTSAQWFAALALQRFFRTLRARRVEARAGIPFSAAERDFCARHPLPPLVGLQ